MGEVHDTPVRVVPATLGPLCSDQLVPSQPSARLESTEDPTASQTEAEGHDTLVRPLPMAVLGVFWIIHRLPSQLSARPEPLE
jgi:hypothetical protein